MKTAIVESLCECEARLFAELDEHYVVLGGWAKDRRRGRELTAPSNTVRTLAKNVDVGWSCPFCTRNVLRPFDISSLSFREARTAQALAPTK